MFMALVAQQELQNDAGGDCHQQVVAAILNPVVATRWRRQLVTVPIFHHILPPTVFGWQTSALAKVAIRSGTAFVASGPVILVLPVVACLLWWWPLSAGILVWALILAGVGAVALTVAAVAVV